MKFLVIYTDIAGYPLRRGQLARITGDLGGSFLAISPDDIDLGIPQVRLPEAWVPPGMERRRADHLRAGYQWIQAVAQFQIDADFIFGIEGDVSGDDDAWRRLFSTTSHPQIDIAAPFLRHSPDGFRMFGAVVRFSRRSIPWIAAKAEETRVMLHENSMSLAVHQAGGTVADLRRMTPRLFSRRTLRFCQLDRPQPVPLSRPGMLCHPCKYDNPIPP